MSAASASHISSHEFNGLLLMNVSLRQCATAVASVSLFAAMSTNGFEVTSEIDGSPLAEQEFWSVDGWHPSIEPIDDSRLAVLTDEGVFELSNDLELLNSYEFNTTYQAGVQFARIDNELYIVGSIWKDTFWGFNNDIHLLRYGESSPLKTWRCGACTRPRIVYFNDFSDPVMVYASTARGNQELRIVDLGTFDEWSVDAAGYRLSLQLIGVDEPSLGLQDVLITIWRDKRRRSSSDPATTVRLSDIDWTRKGTHIRDFENKGSPRTSAVHVEVGDYQEGPVEYGDFVSTEGTSDAFYIAINTLVDDEPVIQQHAPEDPGFLWWTIESDLEHIYVHDVLRPHLLNCRFSTGRAFDAYIVMLVEFGAHSVESMKTRLYELRAGGYWREMAQFEDRPFGVRFRSMLPRTDHILVGLHDVVVRLHRGKDYCSEGLDRFNAPTRQ